MKQIIRCVMVGVLLWLPLTDSLAVASYFAPFLSPFKIYIPPELGAITRFYIPSPALSRKTPDFILIQDVHCNESVQHAISDLLMQLRKQNLLPRRIAVEGAVGTVHLQSFQDIFPPALRRKTADRWVAEGKITGAEHFVLAEGQGELYGVERADLYKTSVEMFRRSYAARQQLQAELNDLEAALNLLKRDSYIPAPVSLLSKDIQLVRHLTSQQLLPSETHDVINEAVLAVDHLWSAFPQRSSNLVEAVSASVNFYALALLRDEALFKHSLELRGRDGQKTTVIVAGGFHTPGLTQRLIEKGYSYVVITPSVRTHTPKEERLYVARLLGYPLTPQQTVRPKHRPLSANPTLKKAEIRALAARIQRSLPYLEFSTSPMRYMFTATDLYWLQPSIRLALIKQRSKILSRTFIS